MHAHARTCMRALACGVRRTCGAHACTCVHVRVHACTCGAPACMCVHAFAHSRYFRDVVLINWKLCTVVSTVPLVSPAVIGYHLSVLFKCYRISIGAWKFNRVPIDMQNQTSTIIDMSETPSILLLAHACTCTRACTPTMHAHARAHARTCARTSA